MHTDKKEHSKAGEALGVQHFWNVLVQQECSAFHLLVSEGYIASQSAHLTICHNTLREFLQVFGQKHFNSVKNNLCSKYLVSCFRNTRMENSGLVMMLYNKLSQK